MSTISLYANKINQMPQMIKSAKSSFNSLRSDLISLKSKMLTIDSSVCNTDDIVNSIHTSTQIQERKISSLEKFDNNCESFIEDVLTIDNDVSDTITQRKNEFYEKYSYLKPECEKSDWEKFKAGLKKAGEWCKEHWKLIVTVVLVIAAVVVIIVCPASAVLLLGIAKGLLSGALIGGLVGGISSAAAGGSFLDGFEDGAFSGALTGALFGGLGAGGQLFGKAFGSSCRAFSVIKHTSRVTTVLSLGMSGFDLLALGVGMFDPDNALVQFNQKLHTSKLYNVAQFAVSMAAVFTSSAYKTMKPMEKTCFVAGTLILTQSGLVAIETIKAGDKVISLNADTFERMKKTVRETYVRKVYKLIHLTINKEKIITTADHPFFVKGSGFINADGLIVGDELSDSYGNSLVVEKINTEILKDAHIVYNFQVDDFHTYCVGKNNILVHNAGKGYTSGKNINYDKTRQIEYGSSDLSETCIEYRQENNIYSARNVSTFEYMDGNTPQKITMASQRGVGHAERLVAKELERLGIKPSQVTRIYSELEPCTVAGGYCKRFIQNTFPQADVTYSFKYGADQLSRTTGINELKNALAKIKI